MQYTDEKLQALRQRVARKEKLTAMLNSLYAQREELDYKVQELDSRRIMEQEDVDRLEGRSLAAFFYQVTGKMEEKLDKERAEAYAAAVKYDAAVRELEAAKGNIRRYEAELKALAGCEEEYAAALEEKKSAIKTAGTTAAEEILRLEETLSCLKAQQQEIAEAVEAGNIAYDTAGNVLSSLDSAEGWGTWDLFGGGLLADLAKYGELDEAQSRVEHLQIQLDNFKTELADVQIQRDMQVSIDGFFRFADCFFDNLFTDWAVLDHISQSKAQVENTRRQVETVLLQLEAMGNSNREQQRQAQEKLDTLIVGTAL